MKVIDYQRALNSTYSANDNIYIQIWDEKEIMNIAKDAELPLNENEASNIIDRLEKRYDDSCFEADTTKKDIIEIIKKYLKEE